MGPRAKNAWFLVVSITMISGAGFVLGARQAVAEQTGSCAPKTGNPCAFAANCDGMCYRILCNSPNCNYSGGDDCWKCDPA